VRHPIIPLVIGLAVSFSAVGSTQSPVQTPAPPPPATEVYLANLGTDSTSAVSGAVNISNNPGYDNQPSFTPDGKAVLFTSERDGKQTDIYRYDIATKVLTQLTHTLEKEYSPLVTPDGKTFSVVRVEADGTQRLWRFDLDGSNPRLILENVKPVGYHVWIDQTHLGLFVLGATSQDPITLQVAETTTGTADTIDSSIGRSLSMRPSTGTMTFVSKRDAQHWVLKEFDPRTRAITTLGDTLAGAEDFAWDPSGHFVLMASGSKVFGWWPAEKAEWRAVGDLSAEGIVRITRLAINPNLRLGAALRLALVAEPKPK
jgi:dipeptidyl aminopeptidase/acylaminoacyl peptidase